MKQKNYIRYTVFFIQYVSLIGQDVNISQAPSAQDKFAIDHLQTSSHTQDAAVPLQAKSNHKHFRNKKAWTFITYMAADNDLAPFARKNLTQQSAVGSTPFINIVTQLDTRTIGNKKITKRYYVEKNKLIVTNEKDPESQQMDSGIPSTLIKCCEWAIKNYPAENYVLVLWNHGTGALDFFGKRNINPFPLFLFNPETNLIDLDRSIPFSAFIMSSYVFDPRGICFDDTTGHYLSNTDLDAALTTICTNFLGGKKFAIICFDACLMSMIEIAHIVKKHAHFMTASQEVELGTGYDYQKMLSPFERTSLDMKTFAQHIVSAYAQAYSAITNDYTQSALNLADIQELEQNIQEFSLLLNECLKKQKARSVSDTIKACRHKLFCTHFDEPSYIDLRHFYQNILAHVKQFSFTSAQEGASLIEKINQTIVRGLALISHVVIANVVGKNLAQAGGISIYFPEKRIQQTYFQTSFSQTNLWSTFLRTYSAFNPT